ncbi:MAG: hypothetical protein AB1813_22180 [Verrucomicrobiota bacterium]
MGNASLKMKRKMAIIPIMLLQPHSRMNHSIGFSNASKRRSFFPFAAGELEAIFAMSPATAMRVVRKKARTVESFFRMALGEAMRLPCPPAHRNPFHEKSRLAK